MAAHQSKIVELAHMISTLSEAVAKYFVDTGASEPSFEPSSAGVPESTEYSALRASLNEATNDLTQLVNGPKHTLRSFGCTHFDLAAFQTALEYGFFEAVPLEGTINLVDLAKKVGIDQDLVGRVLRLLATHRIFVESEPDAFSHTSYSALMVKDSEIRAAAHMQLDDMFRAASSMSDSIRNGTVDSGNNAWKARFGVPMFEYYNQNPIKAARFAKAMEGAARLDRQVSELVEGFPWATLAEGSKVVDCGGGIGHASFVLAQEFPNLNFIVQDISTEMMGHEDGTSDLQCRITFMRHNFFEPQPVHAAAVYFIRQCIHNWDDASAVKILKAFVPALESCKPGTPLLINDTLLPKSDSITRFEERGVRQMDIAMMLQVGGKQRTVEDFQKVLKQADERYEIIRVHNRGSMGLLEVHLVGKNMESPTSIVCETNKETGR